MNINKTIITMGVAVLSALSSCKKDPETEGASIIKGCMDSNAYNYNTSANEESGSCVYIKTTAYEISHYAPTKEDGSNWDSFVNTDADLILRIKENGASNWLFESDVRNNRPPSDTTQWVAPTVVQLKNITYHWELLDDETIGSPETIANGTFNPLQLANNNEIVTKYTSPSGLETQLKIYYFLQK